MVETAVGLDRMFLAVVSKAYQEEELEDGSTRVVLKFPPFLAPYKVAILPLTKKDGLPAKAKQIMHALKLDYNCYYEEKDAIGKRYRRQDAIGTPFCITVDHQTLEDHTVTIRDRDTMEQQRINIDMLSKILDEKVSMKKILKQLA